MAKKSKAETIATRARIVAAAAESFREHGIEATGLKDVMEKVGLTHGGFYRHFASKDALAAEALASAGAATLERVRASFRGKSQAAAIAAIAADYLGDAHRDDAAGGCPFAALGSDIARGGAEVRGQATAALEELVATIAEQRPGPTGQARDDALAMFSTMVGALTLARLVDDPALSDELLRSAIKSVSI